MLIVGKGNNMAKHTTSPGAGLTMKPASITIEPVITTRISADLCKLTQSATPTA